MADLDSDGRVDLISGSWPGEVYFFRRQPDGTFAAGEPLKTADGKPLNVGSASAVFPFDWDGDGRLDLVIGTFQGEVFFVPNVGTRQKPVFGEPRPILAAGQPIKTADGDAAPVVADWDGDGKPDLIVGGGDGSVRWFRNEGTAMGPGGLTPRLAAGRVLVPPNTSAWRDDRSRGPHDWGVRVKPCVIDWDGSGRPSLLLGDIGGCFEAPPNRTPEEAAEDRVAKERLPALRKEWAAAYKEFAAVADAPEPAGPAGKEKQGRALAAARAKVARLKDELARLQDVEGRYQSQTMMHGYVWLFRRLPR